MSAPAVALTVMACVAYAVAGFGVALGVRMLWMDGEPPGGCLGAGLIALAAFLLWPVVLLAVWVVLPLVGLFIDHG